MFAFRATPGRAGSPSGDIFAALGAEGATPRIDGAAVLERWLTATRLLTPRIDDASMINRLRLTPRVDPASAVRLEDAGCLSESSSPKRIQQSQGAPESLLVSRRGRPDRRLGQCESQNEGGEATKLPRLGHGSLLFDPDGRPGPSLSPVANPGPQWPKCRAYRRRRTCPVLRYARLRSRFTGFVAAFEHAQKSTSLTRAPH